MRFERARGFIRTNLFVSGHGFSRAADWYLIPAAVLLRSQQFAVTLYPVRPKHSERYGYECYKEAWRLLLGSRKELARTRRS